MNKAENTILEYENLVNYTRENFLDKEKDIPEYYYIDYIYVYDGVISITIVYNEQNKEYRYQIKDFDSFI